ncbi:MAG: twin-arginine translocase TatA/TatE family subunit [Bryobacteraceae bacterium]|nr:twin-arginine translocase TatA/TatE family subunit [Bryobacteraceae bacterium]
MGPLGVPETIFIFVLALLIFGPKKLPELGRTIGKAMTEFRRASSELKTTFDREMNAIERDTELKEVTQAYNGETYNYDPYYDSGTHGSEPYDYSAQDSSTTGASATQGAVTEHDGSPDYHGSNHQVATVNDDENDADRTKSSNGQPPAAAASEPVKS